MVYLLVDTRRVDALRVLLIEYLRDVTEFASERSKRTIFCFLISYTDLFSSVESEESLLSNKDH